MGVRAYGRETLASLPIDVDKNWNNRSISNVNSLQVNKHITVTARGANRKLYPALNRYDSETDGWYVSKDNGDIERKFWKDDFSVDSSNNYTGDVASFTWDTANSQLISTAAGKIISPNLFGPNYYTVSITPNALPSQGTHAGIVLYNPSTGQHQYFGIYLSGNGYHARTTGTILTTAGGSVTHTLGVPIQVVLDASNPTSATLSIICTGGISKTRTVDLMSPGFTSGEWYVGVYTSSSTWENSTFKAFTCCPSISYSDDFSSDTVTGVNGRYVGVTYNGFDVSESITYGTNCISITTSYHTIVQLKSYKFCSGELYFEVDLPSVMSNTDRIGVLFGGSTLFTGTASTKANLVELYYDGSDYYARFLRQPGAWAAPATTSSKVSGIVAGALTKFRIQLDREHGVGYVYIWQGATEPSTPSLKFYFTSVTSEDSFRVLYYFPSPKTSTLKNISIRAESIVGRTNVEVTEPFWFRDEFREDSIGRYVTANGSIAGGKLTISKHNFYCTVPQIISGSASVETKVVDFVSSTWASINLFSQVKSDNPLRSGYKLETCGTSVRLWKDNEIIQFVNNVITGLTEVTLRLEFDSVTNTVTGYVNGDTVITYVDEAPYTSGYACLNTYSAFNPIGFDYFEVSGTRVYNKPIHRGAMLETYHDGTQEVVGTTFVDDCQWDRTSEWTPNPGTVIAHNAAEGCVSVSRSFSSTMVERNDGLVFGDGIFEIDLNLVTPDARQLSIYPYGPNKYRVILYYPNSDTPSLVLQYYNGSGWSRIGSYTYTFATGTWYTIRFEKFGTTFNVYLNGELVITGSDSHFPSATGSMLLDGFKGGSDACEYKFRNLVIIAAESSSTNGIAACIPPVGGGARYGEQEKVYKQLVNAAKFGEYKATASIKTTNADAEAIEMYFKNITDTTNIAIDDTDTLAISLSDTDYAMSTKDLQLLHRDRGDTIEVAVRKTSAATEVSPACYVTDLMILPKMEG